MPDKAWSPKEPSVALDGMWSSWEPGWDAVCPGTRRSIQTDAFSSAADLGAERQAISNKCLAKAGWSLNTTLKCSVRRPGTS